MHVALFVALAVATAPEEDAPESDTFCAGLTRYVDEAPRHFESLRDPEDARIKYPLSRVAYGGGPQVRTTSELDATVRLGDAASCTLRPGARALMRTPPGDTRSEGSVEAALGDEPYSHCSWYFRDVDAARAQHEALVAKVERCLQDFDKSVEENDAEKRRYRTRFFKAAAPDVLVRVYPTSWRETTVVINVFMPNNARDRRR